MQRLRWFRLWISLLVGLCVTASANAVVQSDGTPIPQGPNVQNLFNSRNEPLNALNDAALTPQRFVPGCSLTFTLVTRDQAVFQNSFGWYNVTSGPPSISDLHVLIPCDAPTGYVATLDLRNEPAYRGGEIGFFLRTPESNSSQGSCGRDGCCARTDHEGYTYFTERAYNPDNTSANPYIHLLIYDSRVTQNAFYFAWEDLYSGGDNQFTDFVALVSNIVCSGAGGSCQTGEQGVCADGVQQCRSGSLQCVRLNQPSTERCDGLDNDCNGMTDEGNLCPSGEVCDRGQCVPRCVEGGCFENQVCSSRGTCVASDCATVNCPQGQTCMSGQCTSPCTGVQCPLGQECRAGRCADPCTNVTCDTDQVCVSGVCQPKCQCRSCSSGQVCNTDGRCLDNGCNTITCSAGQVCRSGQCVDACMNAVCPRGEMCSRGECVAVMSNPDAGVTTDSGPNQDVPRVDIVRPDSQTPDGSTTDTGLLDGTTGTDGGFPRGMRSGCGCRTVSSSSTSNKLSPVVYLLLGLSIVVIRRRRPNTKHF